ncbi:MAG: Heme-binding protein A precursor [Bacteroidetes bacterium ADurb.Bin397]|nr:MAG: Heme-binding protein A precursor [Bacteroidetes bacterium ADurb.Bin397]
MRNPVLILLIIINLLGGCKRQQSASTGKQVFRYNEASGIRTLDPAFAKGQADIWACNQIFNGLVQMNDKLETTPAIAYRWEISEDGKIYTFFLRKDVQFHDDPLFPNGKGRAVTASDFVFSFKRILDPKLASPGAWVFNQVDTQNDGFVALSDSVLQIQLKQPFPPFSGLLSTTFCSVVPHEIVNHYGNDFRTHPVGTGPFRFHLWVERTNLIFHKNENYFEFENDKRLPFVDAVVISFINDRQSAFMEFVKGNLDFLSGIDASYKDELISRQGSLKPKYENKFKMEKCAYLNTEYLGFIMDSTLGVMKNNPLNNILIRQAINYGFDRRKMITFLRNGIGTPGEFGIVPPGLPSFDSTNFRGYHYNPGKTAELLAQAGYPGGRGLPVITMSTTREYQDICEFMQGQLAESGIRIKLEVNQGAAHREMVAKQELSFFRASWIADYPDAENYLSLFYGDNLSPRGPNYTHFNSEKFNEGYRNASATTNDSLRFSIYKDLDQQLMNESPVVVLYYDQVVRLYQNNVHGLGNNAMNLLSIKKVSISE